MGEEGEGGEVTTFLRAFWPTLGLAGVNVLIELVTYSWQDTRAVVGSLIRYAILAVLALWNFMVYRRLLRWEKRLRG